MAKATAVVASSAHAQAALDDGRIPPDQAAETERRRRMLVDRLRRGQVAGMFDPVLTLAPRGP